MEPISRDSEEVVKLDNRITQKSASLLLIEGQIKEKEVVRDNIGEEIRLIKRKKAVHETSLRKKQEADNNYSSSILEEANKYLEAAKKEFKATRVDRAQFEKEKSDTNKMLAEKKSQALIKEKQLLFRELVVEENEKKAEAMKNLITENSITEGLAKDAVTKSERESAKLELLVNQNKEVLRDIDTGVEDIRKGKLELATQRGAIGTLMKLYGN